MDIYDKILNAVKTVMKSKTSGYDTPAVVKRIEGNTAWVHIDGGVDETPVDMSIACKKGDTVRVRLAGGSAHLTGNDTRPPTDDAVANIANKRAVVAEVKADEAQTTASEAEQEAAIASQTAEAADTKADTALEQVGASITTDTLHYLATDLDSGVTTSTPGWTTTVQSITSALPYLWTYHTYHKASGQSVNTQPVITGVYGDTGAIGPQGPAGQQGEQGPAGSDGDDGISVTAVQPQYHLHTSPTATASEIAGWTWSNQLVYEFGKYIWTHDYITYSNNSHSSSEAIYNQALTEACSTSEQALNVAEGIDEHFWYDNTGAHVTEDTQEDYEADPANAGGNTLITSQGMAIRKGTTELASFGASGATIGQNVNGKSRAEISSAGLSIVQKIGNTDISIGALGYGAGVDEDGNPLDAPYYDIGQRAAATTKGNFSVVEGVGNAATAYSAHAEGHSTTATGAVAHAEGLRSEASGDYAHAEGIDTIANGDYSHAEGRETWTTGDEAHAEGFYTRATGAAAHAEGSETTASGTSSHAGGYGTKAVYANQYAIGKYNNNKSGDLFEIGNGTANNARSNAFEVTDTGNVTASGSLSAGNIDCGTKTLNEVAANNYGNTTVNFNKTFSSAPHVVATIRSQINNANMGAVTLMIYSISKSSFVVRLANNSSYARTLDIEWIAIGA